MWLLWVLRNSQRFTLHLHYVTWQLNRNNNEHVQSVVKGSNTLRTSIGSGSSLAQLSNDSQFGPPWFARMWWIFSSETSLAEDDESIRLFFRWCGVSRRCSRDSESGFSSSWKANSTCFSVAESRTWNKTEDDISDISRGVHTPKPMMHISHISAKKLFPLSCFCSFSFFGFPLLWPWCICASCLTCTGCPWIQVMPGVLKLFEMGIHLAEKQKPNDPRQKSCLNSHHFYSCSLRHFWFIYALRKITYLYLNKSLVSSNQII